jgi:hypothetical protein
METSGTAGNVVEPALVVVAADEVLNCDHAETATDAGSVVAAAAGATGANDDSDARAAGLTTESSSTPPAAGQQSVAAAPAVPAEPVRTTGDNVDNDDNGDEDDDDDDLDNDGINIDHYYDPQHQPDHGIRANCGDQRRRKPRQPGPSLSSDPERAFAAICKSALADLAGWDAAAARLDEQAQLVLQRSIERSVRDDNARLRDAATMRRLAETSQAHTAKARFLRIVAQLQLAAWVRLRQQEDDMRQRAAKAQFTAVLTLLLDQRDDQRNRLALRRDVKAGRLWAALVDAFDVGVVVILPSALGFSNQG